MPESLYYRNANAAQLMYLLRVKQFLEKIYFADNGNESSLHSGRT